MSCKFDPTTSYKYMLNLWQKYRKEYKIDTLHFWCREDNFDAHNELELKYNTNHKLDYIIDPEYKVNKQVAFIDEDIKTEKIVFNKRYLLDKTTLLNDNNDIFVQNFNDSLLDNNIKTIIIKSPYDIAKTTLTKQIVNNYKRILWLSYRVTLSNDIKGNFKELGFESYQDTLKSEKLIIQLESLLKLENNIELFIDNVSSEIPYYDLIIIDESEGVLNQFSSDTMKGQAHEIYCLLENIINNSPKLIVLDGDISSRTTRFISNFGNYKYLYNENKCNIKNIKVIKNKIEYLNDIYKSLDENKKIVIATQSSKIGKFFQKKIMERYSDKMVKLYYGKTGDKEKKKLVNVEQEFDEADVLIYSPTIEAGVSYDKPRFYKLYGVLSENANSQRAFFQMLPRVRKFETDEILILNEKLKYNEAKFYTFDEIKQNLINTQFDDNQLFYNKMTKIDEKMIKQRELTSYGINYVYNLLEEKNKHKYLFLYYFKLLALNKGHNIIIEDDSPDYTAEEKELVKLMKHEKQLYDYKDVLEAKDIRKPEHDILQKEKKQGNISELDKSKLEKYYYKQLLGVDILNDEIIKLFCNNCKIRNFINLIDILNYKQDRDDMKFINKQKIDIVHSIIYDFGFKNVFDTKIITPDEFNERAEIIKNNNQLFKNNNLKVLFNKLKITNKFETNKAFLGIINSVLENYSIKIQYIQKKIKGKLCPFYKLEILDNVDEIIQYKVNKGFKLVDTNNIFKFDTEKVLRFDELLNETKDTEEDEYFFEGLNMEDIEVYLRILFNDEQQHKTFCI